MEINQIIKKINSENQGLFLIEINNSEKLELIEKEIKSCFFEKQYEIDTCFLELKSETVSKFISIDQIRKLKKEFLHTNVLNLNKIIFIKEITELNNNSINGLLKLIEEVPQKTFFIFCTSNLLRIPKTVLSRSRILRLNDFNSDVRLNIFAQDLINQNQNIAEEIIQNLIYSFISLEKIDFFENVKLFTKNQIDICSIIFLKVLNFNLRKYSDNRKLYKYLFDLHSDYLYDVNESLQYNTLTNDLISIYFTRLHSNIIKYGK